MFGVSFPARPAKFLDISLVLPVALDIGRHTARTFGRIEAALTALHAMELNLEPHRPSGATSCGTSGSITPGASVRSRTRSDSGSSTR